MNRVVKFCHFILFCIFMLIICFIAIDQNTCQALRLVPNQIDPENSVLNTSNLEKNKDEYIIWLKEKLYNGKIENIGPLAKKLIDIDPGNKELKAIYSIYLFSTGADKEGSRLLLQLDAVNTAIPLYARAFGLSKDRKWDAAIKTCEKAIQQDRKHPFPYNLLGSIYVEQNKLDDGSRNFQKAIDLNPRFAPAYTNAGQVALKQNNFAKAEQYFNKAVLLEPVSATPYYGLARVHFQAGKKKLALKEVQKSLHIKQDQPQALTLLFRVQSSMRMYKEALKTAQHLETVGDRNAPMMKAGVYLYLDEPDKSLEILKNISNQDNPVRYLMGLCYMHEKNFNAAEQQMKKIITDYPQHSGANFAQVVIDIYQGKAVSSKQLLRQNWEKKLEKLQFFIVGCLDAKQSQWDNAFNYWGKAQGIFTGFNTRGLKPEILEKDFKSENFKSMILSLFYFFQNFDQPAIQELENILRSQPYLVLPNYIIAQVYQRKGNLQTAEKYYTNSLKYAPDFYAAVYMLGEIGFLSKNSEKAIANLSHLMQLEKSPKTIYRLASVYAAKGDFEKAENTYRLLIKEYPNLMLGYNQLAWMYAQQGRHLDEALKLAIKADQLQPDNPIILDTLGWIYYKKKDLDQAERYLKKAYSLNRQIPTILYHYGVVQYALGKNDWQSYIKQSLTISDKFDGADDARKLLNVKN